MRADLAADAIVERYHGACTGVRRGSSAGSTTAAVLVATRFGETDQIHRVRSPLAAREQQSFEPEGLAAAVERSTPMTSLICRRAAEGLLSQPGQPAVSLTDGRFRDGAALRRTTASESPSAAISRRTGSTGRERESIDVLDAAAAAPAAAPPPPPPSG